MIKLKQLVTLIFSLVLSVSYVNGAVEKIEKKTFNVKEGGNLYIETDKGSITVNTHSSNSIIVELILIAKTEDEDFAEELFNAFRIKYDNDGTNLSIKTEYKGDKNWLRNIFGGSKWNKLNAKFQITVPEKYNVDLNTSGGGINVGDLEGLVKAKTSGGGLLFGDIKGNIKGRTSGGGISVGECIGNIDINTSGGGIKINKSSGKIDAHTSGGGITVNEIYGIINASTSGGSILVSILEQPKENCKLSTSGGGITVKLAQDISIYLDAMTSGGSVRSDFPITIKGKTDRSKLKGAINSGGPELYLRTSGGSIKIVEYD